jgi:hypothetical protein
MRLVNPRIELQLALHRGHRPSRAPEQVRALRWIDQAETKRTLGHPAGLELAIEVRGRRVHNLPTAHELPEER